MNILQYKLNAIMAKSRALYGKRLTGKDYENLINCSSVAEITAYLRTSTVYSEMLEKISASDISAGHLEFLLKKSELEIFSRLYRYEIAFGQKIYDYFVKSGETDFVLSKVRSILLNSSYINTAELPQLYAGSFDFDMYALAKAGTMEKLMKVLEGTPYKDLLNNCYMNGAGDYLDYECVFFNYLSEFEYKLIKKCYGENDPLMKLLSFKADTEFIDKIYRMKKYFSNSSDRVLSSIAPIHLTCLTQKQIQALMSAADEKAVLEVLMTTAYGKYAVAIKNADHAERAIAQLNYEKYRHLLRFGRDPHEAMFCFMFLMGNEISNLIHIIEGVKYKLDAESIKKLLIGVGD